MENEHNGEQLEAFRLERGAQHQTSLKKIIDAEITPGNIKSFMDVAFFDLVQLTQEASYDYASTRTVKQGVSQADIEDEAFEFFGLENVSSLLDTIEEKRKTLDAIDAYISESLIRVESVHTPSDVHKIPEHEEEHEDGAEMAPNTTPDRLKIVLYILMRDFKLDLADVSLTAGVNAQNMMRKESYVTIDVQKLNRILELCDEVGNRTFVYNREKVLENEKTPKMLRAMTKQEKRAWLREYPGSGISFINGKHWRDTVAMYLSEEGEPALVELEVSDDQKISCEEELEALPSVARGENDPYRNFWRDEAGSYWGSQNAVAEKLGIERRALERAISGVPGLIDAEKRLRDASGNVIERAHCLNAIEALPVVHKLAEQERERRSKPSVAKEDNEATGDIAGFWRDDNGRHFGGLKRIARILGVNPGEFRDIIDRITVLSVKEQFLRDGSGNFIEKAYCLEEVEGHPVVQAFIHKTKERRSKPSVAKEDNEATGDIAGFWRDDNGRHFGGLKRIARILGVNPSTLYGNMSRVTGLSVMEDALCDGSRIFIDKAYCLEEVKEHPVVQTLIARRIVYDTQRKTKNSGS